MWWGPALIGRRPYRPPHSAVTAARSTVSKGLEDDGKVAGADVYGTPRSNGLCGVDLRLHILEMSLAKALRWFALNLC